MLDAAGAWRGRFKLALPGRPYPAVRIRRTD
jgi:hypothetical protein